MGEGSATVILHRERRLIRGAVDNRGAKAVRLLGGLFLSIGLVTAGGCSKKDPYVPPDLLYLFETYDVGKNPTSVSTGDFNHDGVTDLVTTNIGNNSLSMLFGNGDGTFRKQVRIPTCLQPRALAPGDYNRDGLIDLALACSGSDEVRLMFGHEAGTFGLGPSYAVHRSPVSITNGDANGDGYLDLLVALRNDKIQVLLGRGNGSFQVGAQYQYGDTPTSIAATDLNRDGKLDLAVTNGGPMSSAVSIWLGNGDGTFRAPQDYRTGKRPLRVTFADFDADKRTDLLVINMEKDSFTVFLGNGDGTFQPGKEDGANAGPAYGLARDFDGDQYTDVAIVNTRSNDLSILYGRGDGTFRYPPRNYRTTKTRGKKGGPFAIALFYLNAQELEVPGLVVANNAGGSVSVFLHRGFRRHHEANLEQS